MKPNKPKLNTLDEEVGNKILKIQGVHQVFSVVSILNKIPRLVYEVYMDITEFRKNPNNKQFDVLKSDDIKIIHSGKFISVLD